jgi:phospholipid/cholesterol/gamma-HCH transport system permease protein
VSAENSGAAPGKRLAVGQPRRLPLSKPLRDVVLEAGDVVGFSTRAVVGVAGGGRYFAEVLRQCALLVAGSTVVILGLVFVVGGECGLFIVFVLRSLGASSFSGFLTSLCGVREMFPYMFGYVFAAKVGCGLVAEIGSMRISDELDAMESVGIDPMRYVVATRLMAVWLTIPALYATCLVVGAAGVFSVVVLQFGEVSRGQFETLYFLSQTVQDNLYSFIKVMSMATVVALVGMYYGYRASGGPVGVGAATARSMVVNLVLIHVIGASLTGLFWGSKTKFPFGG